MIDLVLPQEVELVTKTFEHIRGRLLEVRLDAINPYVVVAFLENAPDDEWYSDTYYINELKGLTLKLNLLEIYRNAIPKD